MDPPAPLINDGNIVQASPDETDAVHTPQNGTHHKPSFVLHRSLHENPHRVLSAQGNYLHLSNGQKIFDATGGAAVACLGHGNQRVQTAITTQMSSLSYCHSLFYSTPAAEFLASFLSASTSHLLPRVFITSSGSEAMESALKLARQYHLEKSPPEPGRVKFIARKQSYHGTTLGALSVGGHVARRALFEPILSEAGSLVSPCYAYRGKREGEEDKGYVGRLEVELEEEFRQLGEGSVAAFIAEPVVGAALGCVPPVEGYFAMVRRVCDKYGALLILDEVMSGCGRIGPEPSERFPKPLHAWQDPVIGGGVVPDIMTMGKGLGGGYMPVAGMLASRNVVEALEGGSGAFSHGQTYQGHPVACAGALEVQKTIDEENLVENVRVQGRLLGKLLKARLENHPQVGDIRGRGLFWGIEFVKDKETNEPFDPTEGVAMGVHELGMREPYSISLYPGSGSADGKRGDHVLLAPAYNITGEEIQWIVDTTARVVEQFFRGWQIEGSFVNGHGA